MRGIAPTLLPHIGTGLKIEFEDEPSAVIPTIAAIATRAAIKPYSIAVTPHSSFDNLEIRPTMSERRYSGIPSGVTQCLLLSKSVGAQCDSNTRGTIS